MLGDADGFGDGEAADADALEDGATDADALGDGELGVGDGVAELGSVADCSMTPPLLPPLPRFRPKLAPLETLDFALADGDAFGDAEPLVGVGVGVGEGGVGLGDGLGRGVGRWSGSQEVWLPDEAASLLTVAVAAA